MRTLEVTSYIGCPVGCDYCPQDVLCRNYEGIQRMTLDNFAHLLMKVPKDVRIDFSGFSEIFHNPEGSEMIRFAFKSGYAVVLYTTLSGFDPYADVHYLKGVQFTDLCFHQSPRLDLAEFEMKRHIFETEINVGRVAVIEPQWKWSRAGNVWTRETKYGAFKCIFADKRFDHNVLLPSGDVVICCQDYQVKHKIGNLYDTHFDKLDRQPLTDMSNEFDSDIICRKCEIAQF